MFGHVFSLYVYRLTGMTPMTLASHLRTLITRRAWPCDSFKRILISLTTSKSANICKWICIYHLENILKISFVQSLNCLRLSVLMKNELKNWHISLLCLKLSAHFDKNVKKKERQSIFFIIFKCILRMNTNIMTLHKVNFDTYFSLIDVWNWLKILSFEIDKVVLLLQNEIYK